jgi:hypothetical protein
MAAKYVDPTDWKQSSLSSLLEGTGRTLQPASARKISSSLMDDEFSRSFTCNFSRQSES